MKFGKLPIKHAPLLFVKATNRDKSMAREVHLVMFHGVSLTTVTILDLGADQCMKINSNAQHISRDVISIHVDEIISSHQS